MDLYLLLHVIKWIVIKHKITFYCFDIVPLNLPVVIVNGVHVVEVVLKIWIVQLHRAQVLISDANTLSCNTTSLSYMYPYVYLLIMTTTQQE